MWNNTIIQSDQIVFQARLKEEQNLSKDEFERYRIKILKQLEREPLSISELAEAFAPKRQDLVLRTIEILMDEGELEKVDEKLVWKKWNM